MSGVATGVVFERRLERAIPRAVFAATALVAGLVGLQLWAITLGYPLRVTSDVPTFIALLRSIEYGWRQETIAESAQKISQLGRDLYDRIINFIDHVEDVGEHLEKSIRSYNSAVGSLEKMLLQQARKFKELGVEGKKDVPEPLQITLLPRSVAAAAD